MVIASGICCSAQVRRIVICVKKSRNLGPNIIKNSFIFAMSTTEHRPVCSLVRGVVNTYEGIPFCVTQLLMNTVAICVKLIFGCVELPCQFREQVRYYDDTLNFRHVHR